MSHGATRPRFRPHVRLGVPAALGVEPTATRLLTSPDGVPYLVAAVAWPADATGARKTEPSPDVFPPDFALRELLRLDVDDDGALADFQQRWGWSGGTPVGDFVLGDAIGRTADAQQPRWLTPEERDASAWRAQVPVWADDLDADASDGHASMSRYVTVQALRERVLIARALVSVAEAYVNAPVSRRGEVDEDQRSEACRLAWAAALEGVRLPADYEPGADRAWWQWWIRCLEDGLNTLPSAVVQMHGDRRTRGWASWFAVVCVEVARSIERGSPLKRCANDRAHDRDGGWFTEKRDTKQRRRSGHGTPHRVGIAYCSVECERAKSERDRRARAKARAAAAAQVEPEGER